MGNFNLQPDNGRLTMKGTGKVQIKTSIQIYGTGTKMPVMVEADFSNIPHNLHSIYYNSLISQYNTSLNVYDNTKDDEPKTIEEKKSEWRLNRLAELFTKAITK
jgi:hypothetical protein